MVTIRPALIEPEPRSPYVAYLNVVSFGALAARTIGPLYPGMNILYGPNEAGKTTLAAFVAGVLFGWEEARGRKNTYRTEHAERSGSLIFLEREVAEGGKPQARELSRVRNADGLKGDLTLVSDIDRETFRTMFYLTSDELRSLRHTTDITSKLLTAGSGTGRSPAHSLEQVQEKIASYFSTAAGAEHSIVRLNAQKEDLRRQVTQAAQEAERLRKLDREYHELAPERQAMSERLAGLNRRVENLAACQAAVEKIGGEREALEREIQRLRKEEGRATAEKEGLEDSIGQRLAHLKSGEERALRDKIEELETREAKQEHALELSRSNALTSQASYEVLVETYDDKSDQRRTHQSRQIKIALSVILPLVFLVSGIPLFIYGRSRASLTYMALGLALILFALLLAAGAVLLMLRPHRDEESQAERVKDAQWVMLQDKKRLEATVRESEELAQSIAATLDELGLGEAEGSLRRARSLLDEAKDVRAEIALASQKAQAARLRLSEAQDRLEVLNAQQAQAFAKAGLDESVDEETLASELERNSLLRDELLSTFESLNRRFGELEQILKEGRNFKDFDQLKLESQQVNTRLNESLDDLARLLLARRLLEVSIGTWESESQPEVYRQASRFLSLMTAGHWTSVRLSEEGNLQVSNDAFVTRDPLHLSMGTCQQLYLSLRIALLITAQNVGRSIPILADDILVNFDSERRKGAALALAELARHRQVILFSCHQEIVETLREADPEAKLINL